MKNIHKRILIITAIALAAGLTIYRFSLLSVISAVLHREGSSHGVFIPLLSGYFIWIKRDTLEKITPVYDFLGIVLLVIGVLPFFVQPKTFHFHFIGYIIFINGLILIVLGKHIFKEIAFPITFLVAMTPLTGTTYSNAADIMRHITFKGALWVTSIFDITYYKSGWLLHLPNTTLEVAMSCSGIRYLVSYFIFGIAYAYLFRRTSLSRISVVALTIPISLMASIIRLTVIFLATYYISPKMAEYWPHVFISWSVFFVVLMLSIFLDQHFQNRRDKRKVESKEAGKPVGREAKKLGS